MPNGVAILTGQTGPGATVTALQLNDVHSMNFDFEKLMLKVNYGTPSKTFELSLTGVTTVSDSITSGVHTVTVS